LNKLSSKNDFLLLFGLIFLVWSGFDLIIAVIIGVTVYLSRREVKLF